MKMLLLIVSTLLLAGCNSTVPPKAALTAGQATTLAQHLANDEATTRYHSRPFGDGATAQFDQGRWIWSERHGFGQGDLEASVFLAADGSTNHVELKLLDNRVRLF